MREEELGKEKGKKEKEKRKGKGESIGIKGKREGYTGDDERLYVRGRK